MNGPKITFGCPDQSPDSFKLVSSEKNNVLGNEAWEMLSVPCEEGDLGWLRVNHALFQKIEAVLEGAITAMVRWAHTDGPTRCARYLKVVYKGFTLG